MTPGQNRQDSLIRQLQGALGGSALAWAHVSGGGGSSYTGLGGVRVASVTGTGTGVCRVVFDASAISTNDIDAQATVKDNGSYLATCQIIDESPLTIDVYQWRSSTEAATNRSFFLDVKYKSA